MDPASQWWGSPGTTPRQGEWVKGLSTLFHPYNFLSLAALFEGHHWLQG